jgi:carbonate dehydratase
MVVRRLLLPVSLAALCVAPAAFAQQAGGGQVAHVESASAPIVDSAPAGEGKQPAGASKAERLEGGLRRPHSSIGTHQPEHWSYHHDRTGPDRWGELDPSYAVCGSGKNQSPVDLREPDVRTRSSTVRLDYRPARFSVKNSGMVVQAKPKDSPRLPAVKVDERTFVLKQFHFHSPSDHTFRGRHFPLEVHLVHESEDDQYVVLAAMFRPGPRNAALDRVLSKRVKAGETVDIDQALHVRALLPQQLAHYRLNGSLTTPPCSEGVNWVVFVKPVYASREQIETLRHMVDGPNNRPVQPFNARLLIEETR